MEEFGATRGRSQFYSQVLPALNQAGIPWLFWELYKPGNNPDDFELWTDDSSWTSHIVPESKIASQSTGAFNWPTLPQHPRADDASLFDTDKLVEQGV